jgi:hypothetical protein
MFFTSSLQKLKVDLLSVIKLQQTVLSNQEYSNELLQESRSNINHLTEILLDSKVRQEHLTASFQEARANLAHLNELLLESKARQQHLRDLLEQTSLSHAQSLNAGNDIAERALHLNGQIAARQVQAVKSIEILSDVEFRVHSQWGEDGIIEWLVSKIPSISTTFIEFGVQSYIEANTRFLMRNRGWRGLVMDGDAANVAAILARPDHWMHDLQVAHAFITVENINELIISHGFSGDLGILSIDIDGNDYWVYEAISCVKPAILIVEYNAVFGDLHPITIPYNAEFERNNAHHSNQYFGASFVAVRSLAEARGYHLVGTSSSGVNAFFVRGDLADPILGSIANPTHAWPQRHRDSRDSEGKLSYVRGLDKAALISNMDVYDLTLGRNVLLSEIGALYSETWLRDM